MMFPTVYRILRRQHQINILLASSIVTDPVTKEQIDRLLENNQKALEDVAVMIEEFAESMEEFSQNVAKREAKRRK